MRPPVKRSLPAGSSLTKAPKEEFSKDDSKTGKAIATTNLSSSLTSSGNTVPSSTKSSTHGNELKTDGGLAHSPRHDTSFPSKLTDKQQKRTGPTEELDRQNKRRKGESESKDFEGSESDDQGVNIINKSKDKGGERYERDYRERLERATDKSRGDDILGERSRDRSMERYGRERSVERMQERGFDRVIDKDKNKDDRGKLRYSEASSIERSHIEDRFHGQSLPPPPPLPPHLVPHSVGAGRRDEDGGDRRFSGAPRHSQRLSPRHEEKERRRSEEIVINSQDDGKRRREDDFRERKREEREILSMKVYFTLKLDF